MRARAMTKDEFKRWFSGKLSILDSYNLSDNAKYAINSLLKTNRSLATELFCGEAGVSIEEARRVISLRLLEEVDE